MISPADPHIPIYALPHTGVWHIAIACREEAVGRTKKLNAFKVHSASVSSEGFSLAFDVPEDLMPDPLYLRYPSYLHTGKVPTQVRTFKLVIPETRPILLL
jgi:hypothetical protein